MPNFYSFPQVSTNFLRQLGALSCTYPCSKPRSTRFHGNKRHFAILSMTHCFHALVMSSSLNTLRDNSYLYLGPAVLLVPAWLKH